MNAYLTICGVFFFACSSAVAQKMLTLPVEGVHDDVGIGLGMIVPSKKWLPTRQQCLYATKDLPSSPASILEVAFQARPSKNIGLSAVEVAFTLDMSVAPISPRKRSLTFALNHGKTIVRVFSGKIKLPAVTWSKTHVWDFRIPLSKPFVADRKAGAALVLDFYTTSVITKMVGRWNLVLARTDTGSIRFQGIGYNCHFQKFNILWQTFPGSIFVGSKTDWMAWPLLANQTGFLMLGDAGWGAKWGGLSLPVDLKPFGAAGCKWGVRPLITFPVLVDWRGNGTAKGIRIPADPRLANRKLYTQAAYTYPKANALGMLFLPSLEWRIGSGEKLDASAIAGYTYNNVPPGKVANHVMFDPTVPFCRITYK